MRIYDNFHQFFIFFYFTQQVKCPECRAEHRIPYQGVQGFPTNVTLQRFLELHIEITGELPDPTSGKLSEMNKICFLYDEK